MPSTTQRFNHATRIAYFSEIQRIYYTATLTAFLHQWALFVIGCLIPSALTVLQFYAALHRSSRNGYAGTAVSYELLAPQIARATGRPCSVRTLQRGLAALKALGFISMRFWTIPDQTIHLGGGRSVKLKGTARKPIGGDEWRSLQIRVITLTETACAMWDRATKSAGSRYVGKLPTPAKLAGSSITDQIDKSTMVEVSASVRQPTNDPRQMVLDCEPSVRLDKKGSADEVEGRPTRPVPAQAPPPTLEHGASSFPELPASSGTTEGAGPKASNEAPFSGKPESKSVPKGCSVERPTLPKRPKNKTAWPVGRLFVLNALHKALSNFSQRQADAIYARARFELSRNYPSGWPMSVDWNYWVPRYADFMPQQRKAVMLSQILPLLKSPAVVTPNEPRRRGVDFQGKFEKPPAPRGGAAEPAEMYADFVGLADKLAQKFEAPAGKEPPPDRKPKTTLDESKQNISSELNPYLAGLLQKYGPESTD